MKYFLALVLLAHCQADNYWEEEIEESIEAVTGLDIDLSADDEVLPGNHKDTCD